MMFYTATIRTRKKREATRRAFEEFWALLHQPWLSNAFSTNNLKNRWNFCKFHVKNNSNSNYKFVQSKCTILAPPFWIASFCSRLDCFFTVRFLPSFVPKRSIQSTNIQRPKHIFCTKLWHFVYSIHSVGHFARKQTEIQMLQQKLWNNRLLWWHLLYFQRKGISTFSISIKKLKGQC